MCLDLMDVKAIDVTLLRRLFRQRLLGWYRKHKRDLPWRSDSPNPYHVLVSEAMLQQTQVVTVVPYFNRFVKRWGTIAHLANARQEQVLKQWQGLGYYRRGRNLHLAAQKIMSDFAGRVPDQVQQLLTLPGVGKYTAGAIASIAYGKSVPLVDGNVARVLSRWYAIVEPVDRKDVTDLLWQLAGAMVPARKPGDFNQALMELGALVCTPAKPACGSCPVATLCQANARQLADQLPVKIPKRKPLQVEHHILALGRHGKYLFEQRPSKGLWSTMWQLITSEVIGRPTSHRDSVKAKGSVPTQLLKWCQEHYCLVATRPKLVDQFVHQTTHRTITFYLWSAQVTGGKLKSRAGCWRRLNQLADLPLANPQRKAIGKLECTTVC